MTKLQKEGLVTFILLIIMCLSSGSVGYIIRNIEAIDEESKVCMTPSEILSLLEIDKQASYTTSSDHIIPLYTTVRSLEKNGGAGLLTN